MSDTRGELNEIHTDAERGKTYPAFCWREGRAKLADDCVTRAIGKLLYSAPQPIRSADRALYHLAKRQPEA